MLCDKCQEREATIFTTCVISGSPIEKINLCAECFANSEQTLADEIAAAFQGGCCYCGDKPQCGIPDLDSQKMRMACNRCSDEYYSFLRLKIPGLGQPLATQAKLIAMQDLPAI
jgi:protein-arginine kinase activator protein McsA